MKTEQVSNPTHYNQHKSGIECIDVCQWFGFNVGNAIKYVWRAGLKKDLATQDINKAIWYINRHLNEDAEWQRSRLPKEYPMLNAQVIQIQVPTEVAFFLKDNCSSIVGGFKDQNIKTAIHALIRCHRHGATKAFLRRARTYLLRAL